MDIKVTEGAEAFRLPEWHGLMESDTRAHIFHTPEWNSLWWANFGEGKDLIFLTFYNPEPVAVAGLMRDLGPSGTRLRFLGGDDLTDYLGPLVASDIHLPAVADSLVAYVTEELSDWNVFEAKCLPVPLGFAEWLAEAAHRRGVRFSLDEVEMTAVLPLSSTVEHYMESLPGKKRHELRRKQRRFDAEFPGAQVVRSTPETLDADLDLFIQAHQRSDGEKGTFMSDARAKFFHAVARDFSERGWLSLDSLIAGDRILSTMFSFRFREVFYLYNSIFDREFSALSPGLILVSRLIERCIEEGMGRFDFLRGRERYKLDLGGQPLPLHEIQLFKDKE